MAWNKLQRNGSAGESLTAGSRKLWLWFKEAGNEAHERRQHTGTGQRETQTI